jgi:AcrR family transcriptional regulator
MKAKPRPHMKRLAHVITAVKKRPGGVARKPSVRSAHSPSPVTVGLRERNKLAKERHIREAARRLFSEKGYEATTLREVAAEADVGFGTVASYSTDKAGLLAMVYVEELKALPPLFLKSDGSDDDLLGALIKGLAQLYQFWAKVPWLSRYVLQQMEFYRTNPHMDVIIERRREARLELSRWIEAQQQAGKIRMDVDVAQATDTLFAVYASAVREWSTVSPDDVRAGLTRLRWLMELPIKALLP